MSTPGESTRVIVFALLANLGIAIAKSVGAWISGSAAMLAEAVHSFADSANQVLLLVGAKAAVRPATESHPLGYGRETFFWSFVVAILLFSLGGMFAIYEGAHRLQGHDEVSNPWVGLGILITAIVLEFGSFTACLKEVRRQNVYPDLWTWIRKTTAAELLVVFLEDSAALLGLFIATVCLLLSWTSGNPTWDAAGSILVGIVLVAVAIALGWEIKSLLIGEAPATDFRTDVEEIVRSRIPEGRVLKLIALQTGGNEVMISYKVSPGILSDVKLLITALNQIELEVKARFPQIRWQFIEPDFHD